MSGINQFKNGLIIKAAVPSVTRSRNIPALLQFPFNEENGSTTFVDSSGFGNVATGAGSAAASSTQFKFSPTSLRLNGTSQYLSWPFQTNHDLGTSNFTIEWWQRLDSIPGSGVEYSPLQWNTGSTGGGSYAQLRVACLPNGAIRFMCASAVASWFTLATSANSILTATTWQHIAVVRNGSSFNLYVDGTSRASFTTASAPYSFGSKSLLGTLQNTTFFNYFPGYIDCFRYIKTAVYTGTFTPSSTELPNYAAGSLSNAIYGINQQF